MSSFQQEAERVLAALENTEAALVALAPHVTPTDAPLFGKTSAAVTELVDKWKAWIR